MRARGLKPCHGHASCAGSKSRPMRARGLKQFVTTPEGISSAVAPHAGAWIETDIYFNLDALGYVAPHAGAWIETHINRRGHMER